MGCVNKRCRILEALLALNLERDAAAAAEMKEISNNEHV